VHIKEFEKLKPDFASRARELIGRWQKVDALSDELIDGLHKAGLPVEVKSLPADRGWCRSRDSNPDPLARRGF